MRREGPVLVRRPPRSCAWSTPCGRTLAAGPQRRISVPATASSSAGTPSGSGRLGWPWPAGQPASTGQRVRAVGATEAADQQAGDAVQHAGEAQLGQHAVDAVGLLADVLDEQQRAVDLGQEGRAQQGAEHCEVAADEPPAGAAAAAERMRRGAAHRVADAPAARQALEQRVRVGRGAGQAPVAGGHRRVQRRDAGLGAQRMQHGQVAVADQQLARVRQQAGVEVVQQPDAARAAAQCQHGVEARLGEGGMHVGQAHRVGRGEEVQQPETLSTAEAARQQLADIATLAQPAFDGIEPPGLGRAGRRDDGEPRARPQRRDQEFAFSHAWTAAPRAGSFHVVDASACGA
jgi:hypothetical protein